MKKPPLVLVVREFDKFSSLLTENGFETINFPAIQTFPLEDLSELNEKVDDLRSYDGLFFTSSKAAEVFLQNCKDEANSFCGKVYVLGNRTKLLFENTNFEIVFRQEANTAEEFVSSFDDSEFIDKKFLFLRGDKSLRTVSELLKDKASVDEVIVYRTVENAVDENLIGEIREKLRLDEVNWICFFSPSGVGSFVKTFGEFLQDKIRFAAIGTTTAKRAAENNLKIDFISPTANAEDFAFGLIDYIKSIE